MKHANVRKFALALLSLAAGAAFAASPYPSQTVRIITSQTGGSLDFAARLLQPGLSASLGQPVIIDNRSGNVATEAAARAAADGHTLLFNGAVVWIAPLLRKNTPWSAERDFAPVTLAVSSPNVVAVHPSMPVRTLRELITLAKARPGDINCGVATAGTSSHLAAELFRYLAGINVVHVPYKSAGQSMIGLLAGEVQLMFPNAASVAPYIHPGRVRAIAVTGAQPSPLLPGVPTARASGLPEYETASLNAFFVPAGTPAAVVSRLNQEIVRALNRRELRDKFAATGVEVVGSSPADLAAAVRADVARMSKVIRANGIRAD